MSTFNPNKLHVTVDEKLKTQVSSFPRCYTFTHSDRTGDLFLTIAPAYNLEQISDWYTRLMRDEVLGEWIHGDSPSLHVHCHVSGGLVLGPASWRARIFRHHLPMALSAIIHGDLEWILSSSTLQDAPVYVHFHANQAALDLTENYRSVKIYL